MRSLIRFSTKNKFAIWLLTLMVSAAGLYAGLNMKMETMPDINIPVVTVVSIYPGATPDEVMDKVAKPIEQSLRNLDGVDLVTSTSMENAASIVVQYDYAKDMEQAVSEVKEAFSSISFPAGVQDPQVSRLSFNAFPVLSLSVAKDGSTLEELTRYVREEVGPTLEGIEGVASVQVSGQLVDVVELVFNEQRMNELGVQQETVKGLIQGSALAIPLGIFEFGEDEKAVMVDGNIITLDDLRNLPIPVMPSAPPGGAPGGEMPEGAGEIDPAQAAAMMSGLPTVQLSELAQLEIVGQSDSISRTNGKDAIGISIVKGADANTVEVVNNVKAAMAELEEATAGVEIISVFDQGKPIEDSVHTMLNKAMMGALFAIIIILLFLRDIRSTLISVVSIPLSIVMALLALNQLDITLNIMTLGAMTVAIGRVVDDSIVVIENVYRRLNLSGEKLRGRDLIVEATKEMFVPIMSSTVVTIAVFVPLGLVTGPVGEIFLPFALTIVFALVASLIVAVTVVPMMAHLMFRQGSGGKAKHSHDKQGKLAQTYKSALKWSLNHKLISFGLAILLLIGSFGLMPFIGVSFLPADEEKTIMATYNPAPGETLDGVKDMALEAEKMIMEREGMEVVQYSIGGQNPMNPGASKQALFFITYNKDFKNFSQEKEDVIAGLQGLGGRGEWKEQDFTGGAGLGGSTLSVLVYGPDMKTLGPVVDDLMALMGENDQLADIDSSLSKSYSQYQIVANHEKLASYGLAAGNIAMALSPVRDNPSLATIVNDGNELNVYVKTEQKEYGSIDELVDITLTSPLGIQVPIKDVVEIREGETPNTISRHSGKIYAEVSATIVASDVNKISNEIKKASESLELPPQVELSFGGVTEQINESFTQLGLAMAAAVAVVYFVLVLTFGGGLTPFAILFSLPFTIIGGLLGLFLAGETLTVTAMIGFLMLIGIVVTNAIVLIDRVIQKQKEGLAVREALLEAAGTRLRPILMTALATIGALLPLAFGFESGGLISKGLGVTVIGGLASSTVLTLIIVPVVYEFLARFRKSPHLADE